MTTENYTIVVMGNNQAHPTKITMPEITDKICNPTCTQMQSMEVFINLDKTGKSDALATQQVFVTAYQSGLLYQEAMMAETRFDNMYFTFAVEVYHNGSPGYSFGHLGILENYATATQEEVHAHMRSSQHTLVNKLLDDGTKPLGILEVMYNRIINERGTS